MPKDEIEDPNAVAAGWLLDMAALQTDARRQKAFARAAHAVMLLPEPLATYGDLTEIPYIGPASERVIKEVLAAGESATVAALAGRSGREKDLAKSRASHRHYLSQAVAEAVLREPARGRIALGDYGGDLQMHTTFSDGGDSVREMAEEARRLGHRFAGITDHSRGLAVAGGMDAAATAAQQREIAAVNASLDGSFVVFRSVEANIAADGSLDLTDAELAEFDLVVAAPHAALRGTADQTSRLLAVINRPGVDILGHPRGRRHTRRAGLVADWPTVFRHAARQGVAVEIDGSIERQDVDWTLARAALEAGCVLAVDSDAHATGELLFSRMGLAHARLAGARPNDVVNCWPTETILEWAARRTTARRERLGGRRKQR